MSHKIGNIRILWAFIWLNELQLKANGCIINCTIYFPKEIDMHFVTSCIAQEHIFHVFDWKVQSQAVRKPLLSNQEWCFTPRNRYAASLRPETVTILQRDLWKCEEITLQPEIWWYDAVYEADHYLKWPCSAKVRIFWSWPAKGAVICWTSCCCSYKVME